jgi:hypothetical protein
MEISSRGINGEQKEFCGKLGSPGYNSLTIKVYKTVDSTGFQQYI